MSQCTWTHCQITLSLHVCVCVSFKALYPLKKLFESCLISEAGVKLVISATVMSHHFSGGSLFFSDALCFCSAFLNLCLMLGVCDLGRGNVGWNKWCCAIPITSNIFDFKEPHNGWDCFPQVLLVPDMYDLNMWCDVMPSWHHITYWARENLFTGNMSFRITLIRDATV